MYIWLLFFPETLHKVVTPFLWVIILHEISTVTWCMNSRYTCFCNFEQILFVKGTPVTFCFTVLDFACLYDIPQIPSEDFHLSTNRNSSSIVFHYTPCLYQTFIWQHIQYFVFVSLFYEYFWYLFGSWEGSLETWSCLLLFVSPKDLVHTWFLVHVCWRNHEIK